MIASDHSNVPGSVPEPFTVLGIPVVSFRSYSHAVKCVQDLVESGRKSFWVAINPQKVYRATRDPKLRAILTGADVGICDGIGVAISCKLLHGHFLNRCTGCDLFFAILPVAADKGWRIFMLGGAPRSSEQACARLQARYPRLQIAGRRDGYFRDSREVIEHINRSRAQLLFVAMGSPKQEYWIARHRDAIDAVFCMGVGGTFDVASGAARRAPRIFRRTGTEFLFQAVTQPWRLKRQIVYLPYAVKVLKEKLWGNGRAPAHPERPRPGAPA